MSTAEPNPVLLLYRDEPLDGPANMARDEHLLHAPFSSPDCCGALRIYAWTPPTISLGYFQHAERLAELPPDVRGLPVVRRLTGGGAILHDREVTYSLVLDSGAPLARAAPAELYRVCHSAWREALLDGGPQTELAPDSFPLPTPRGGPFFCFEKPGRTDLLLEGRKLLGSAQRRLEKRILQHGSLLLDQRFASHPGAGLGDPPTERVERWISRFAECMAAAVGAALRPVRWTPAQLGDVAVRREKYAAAAWNAAR